VSSASSYLASRNVKPLSERPTVTVSRIGEALNANLPALKKRVSHSRRCLS